LGGKTIKNEMDGTCGTYGGEGRCIQGFLRVGELRVKDHWEDPGVGGRLMEHGLD
jgi:predicted N-acetyltransferase YhbS